MSKGKSYNFNVKNKVKGSKYSWSSSDTSIATVNKSNGVAKAKFVEGQATISCKITLPGGKTRTIEGTLNVCPDATSVEISNPIDTLPLGQSYDFNKTKLPTNTVNGTYWIVKKGGVEVANTKTGVGTIMNEDGVFTPTEAGTYEIQAVCARSKTATVTRAESKVMTVTVGFEAKQVTDRSFAVNFDQDMSKALTIKNFHVENATYHNAFPIDRLDFSGDGKTVTVVMYSAFTDKMEYQVTYTNGATNLSDNFVASVGPVDHIEIKTQTAVTGKPTEVKYALLDASGIDVTETWKSSGRVVVSASTDGNGYFSARTNELTLYSNGASATVTVEFHTNDFDPVSGVETIISKTGTITAVDPSAIIVTGIKYTLGSRPANWSSFNPKTSIPALQEGKLLVYIETSDGNGYEAEELDPNYRITYESSDYSIININENSGSLYARKPGNAYIIITVTKDGIPYQFSFVVTVTAASQPASVVVNPSQVVLSNSPHVKDIEGVGKKKVTVTVKDQYGTPMDGMIITSEFDRRADDVDESIANKIVTVSGGTGGTLEVSATVENKPVDPGRYTFNICAQKGSSKFTGYLTVIINHYNSSEGEVPEIVDSFTTIDTTFDEGLNGAQVGSLIESLRNDYKISVGRKYGDAIYKMFTSEVTYRVIRDDGKVVYNSSSNGEIIPSPFFDVNDGVLNVRGVTEDSRKVSKLQSGRYDVEVYVRGEESTTRTFYVEDHQNSPILERKQDYVTWKSGMTLGSLIPRAYTKNGKTITEEISYARATSDQGVLETSSEIVRQNKTITIENVQLYVTIGGYKIPANCTIIGDTVRMK